MLSEVYAHGCLGGVFAVEKHGIGVVWFERKIVLYVLCALSGRQCSRWCAFDVEDNARGVVCVG